MLKSKDGTCLSFLSRTFGIEIVNITNTVFKILSGSAMDFKEAA